MGRSAIFDKNGMAQIDRWYALADVLGLKRQSMIDKISSNKSRRFVYCKDKLAPAMAKYIRELKLVGVGLKAESRRYPAGEVSAHLIGVTGIDGHGFKKALNAAMTNGSRVEAGSGRFRKDRYGRVVENIALEEREEGKPLN